MVGLLVFLLWSRLPVFIYVLMLAGCVALGIWVAGEAEQLFGKKDAAPIVIDEIAGHASDVLCCPSGMAPSRGWFPGFSLL